MTAFTICSFSPLPLTPKIAYPRGDLKKQDMVEDEMVDETVNHLPEGELVCEFW